MKISTRLVHELVLERVRGVRVVEPTAVGAQLLDRLLGGDRATCDRLGTAGERGDVYRAGEVLNRPADDEHQREDCTRAAAGFAPLRE